MSITDNYCEENEIDADSSDSGSTIRQFRPPSTATILSRAISDFETDFNTWDLAYKSSRRLSSPPPPLPTVNSRPYTPTPYSNFPTYLPSAISRATSVAGSIHSTNTTNSISTQKSSEEEGENVKEEVKRLGGVGIYNPHFEPGTTFPRRMSRVAIVGDIDTDTGSGTLVEGSTGTTSRSNLSRQEGDEDHELGYLSRLKKDILRKARERKVRKEDEDNDAGEAGEASGSTPAGDTAASGSGDAGSSSNVPTSGSSQRQETPGSSSRNIENIPSTSGASASSSSTSKPSGGKPKPPSLTLQTGKSSSNVNKTGGPPHTKAPSSSPKQEPTESLKGGLKDLSKTYPEARKPSSTRRRSGGRFSSSLSPNPRGRKGNEEEDASSMKPMSPPRPRDTEKPRWAEKYAAFSKWKTKQERKNAPETSEPARPLTQNEARNQTAWRTPREAKAARESELAAKEGHDKQGNDRWIRDLHVQRFRIEVPWNLILEVQLVVLVPLVVLAQLDVPVQSAVLAQPENGPRDNHKSNLEDNHKDSREEVPGIVLQEAQEEA
ncbi:hypothetical protein TWF970_004859 [Orbilia oligospora]|uniref:Uncharacterized protein n=1 Tax=Orbilia oligospora TaxID=2813651 RepID=A0A7C8VN87_ORBOL|nr:hypothetical protein TWF970_004859 [Orbilia oligospora]